MVTPTQLGGEPVKDRLAGYAECTAPLVVIHVIDDEDAHHVDRLSGEVIGGRRGGLPGAHTYRSHTVGNAAHMVLPAHHPPDRTPANRSKSGNVNVPGWALGSEGFHLR